MFLPDSEAIVTDLLLMRHPAKVKLLKQKGSMWLVEFEQDTLWIEENRIISVEEFRKTDSCNYKHITFLKERNLK